MSAHPRSSDRKPLALHTIHTEIPRDCCPSSCTLCSGICRDPMMTSGSLLLMMCLISSHADLTLKSQFVMSIAPADEHDTHFNVLFSTFAIFIVF